MPPLEEIPALLQMWLQWFHFKTCVSRRLTESKNCSVRHCLCREHRICCERQRTALTCSLCISAVRTQVRVLEAGAEAALLCYPGQRSLQRDLELRLQGDIFSRAAKLILLVPKAERTSMQFLCGIAASACVIVAQSKMPKWLNHVLSVLLSGP